MTTIRPETPGDVDAIRRVNAAAFPTPLESRLVDALRAAGKATISLVAEEAGGEVVGHILFSPVTLDPPSPGAAGLGLAPVAVVPERQSRGIGGELIRRGLALAADAGFGFIVVLGEPAYYGRFGFVKASSFGLGNDYGADDPFMALELLPGALAGLSGVARYEPEFGMFE